MTYNELLGKKEWWLKCNEILSRDHFRCRDCGCLGFHNGYNYIKLSCLEEMDSILSQWWFSGMRFSDFFQHTPNDVRYPLKGIKLKKVFCDNNVNIFHLLLHTSKSPLFPSLLQVPTKVLLLTPKEIETLEADVFYLNNVVRKDKSISFHGSAYLFLFEDIITENVYVNMEFTIRVIIDGLPPFDENVINVAYKNRLLSLRFNPLKSGIKGLNIHHTYYMRGCKPWEYKNESLVTLCESCHKKRHETLSVPLYDKYKRLISNLIPCDRCGGSGYLPQYSHVEHGICFKCSGEGVVLNE